MKPLHKTSKTLEILKKQGITLTSINIKMWLPNEWIKKQTIVQVNRGAGRIIQGLFRSLFRIDFDSQSCVILLNHLRMNFKNKS